MGFLMQFTETITTKNISENETVQFTLTWLQAQSHNYYMLAMPIFQLVNVIVI